VVQSPNCRRPAWLKRRPGRMPERRCPQPKRLVCTTISLLLGDQLEALPIKKYLGSGEVPCDSVGLEPIDPQHNVRDVFRNEAVDVDELRPNLCIEGSTSEYGYLSSVSGQQPLR